MKRQIAYIDEFGNSDLDTSKSGVSSHFIITAIILPEDKQEELMNQLVGIRKKYFQTGEMKSSGVGSNDTRRIKILNDISVLDFHIFSIVIPKEKLTSEGYKYKGSFYKNLPSIILRELISAFPEVKISYDEHGSKEFMNSFIAYIKNNFQPDLFSSYELYLTNSRNEVLIQLADLITGTIARGFDKTKLSENAHQYFEILKRQIIEIREWPYQRDRPYELDSFDEVPSEYDEAIANYSAGIARAFITKNNGSSSTIIKDQISFLKLLLFNLTYISTSKYLSTRDIINNLNVGRHADMSVQHFRNKVVGNLRDSHILIASGDSGYKLPTCKADLIAFINHFNHYIKPMLTRVEKCRDNILLMTTKKLDVLDFHEFEYLKDFFDKKPHIDSPIKTEAYAK